MHNVDMILFSFFEAKWNSERTLSLTTARSQKGVNKTRSTDDRRGKHGNHEHCY